MKIVAADWLPYALPLRRPWHTHQGSLLERRGELLRLRTDSGLTGWGDSAPWPAFGITDESARRFAEETARLDLAAQQAGQPLHIWLGARHAVNSLAVNANLGSISDCTLAMAIDAVEAGYQILKIKLGVADADAELGFLETLCGELPAPIRLRLDANAAWSFETAREFIRGCAGLPVEGLEEPLHSPDAEQLARLQAIAHFPLAIDESTQLIGAAFFRQPPVHRLIIKPAREGGLLASRDLAQRAAAAGVECIVTASLESACGLLACAQLAAAVAPDACHGLGTASWFAADTGRTAGIDRGRLRLEGKNGLGFAPGH